MLQCASLFLPFFVYVFTLPRNAYRIFPSIFPYLSPIYVRRFQTKKTLYHSISFDCLSFLSCNNIFSIYHSLSIFTHINICLSSHPTDPLHSHLWLSICLYTMYLFSHLDIFCLDWNVHGLYIFLNFTSFYLHFMASNWPCNLAFCLQPKAEQTYYLLTGVVRLISSLQLT